MFFNKVGYIAQHVENSGVFFFWTPFAVYVQADRTNGMVQSSCV